MRREANRPGGDAHRKKSGRRSPRGRSRPGGFSTFSKVAPRLESFTGSRSKWRQDEFYASVLFLSSGYMVAPRVEDLSGSDGVACRTPLLLACSSETGFGLLSVTIIIKS
jgi:hypothetical protein